MLCCKFDLGLKIPEGYIPFPSPQRWNVKDVTQRDDRRRINVSVPILESMKDDRTFMTEVAKRLCKSEDIKSACIQQLARKPINDFKFGFPDELVQNLVKMKNLFFPLNPVIRGQTISVFLDQLILLQAYKRTNNNP